MRARLFKWLQAGALNQTKGLQPCIPVDEYDGPQNIPNMKGEVKIVVKPALNGRIVMMQAYKPVNGPQPDWESTVYLVPEGNSLIEAITTLLVSAKVG